MAVVRKNADGKTEMVTKTGATSQGALMGGFWGMLIGLLFIIPVAGLIIGGLMGAVMGTMGGWGISNEFRQRGQNQGHARIRIRTLGAEERPHA